eukprot:m.16298 g.16298  ORF g.16298 m.16298 type:complete len:754 (-) comp3490_c0_seq1:89-2350(-)
MTSGCIDVTCWVSNGTELVPGKSQLYCNPWDSDAGYFIGAMASGVFCTLIILHYWLFKQHRAHPSPLLLWRVNWDLLLCILTAIAYGVDATRSQGCNKRCEILGALTQIALANSDAWYFLLSVDLYLTLRNPFSFTKSNMKFYHLFSWGFAIVTTVIANYIGGFGLSLNYLCWLKEDPCNQKHYGLILWLMPQVLFLAAAIYVLFVVHRAFGGAGLPDSAATRRRVISHSRNYVAIIGGYWLALAILYVLHLIDIRHRTMRNHHYVNAFVVARSCRGAVNLIAWLTNVTVTTGERHLILKWITFGLYDGRILLRIRQQLTLSRPASSADYALQMTDDPLQEQLLASNQDALELLDHDQSSSIVDHEQLVTPEELVSEEESVAERRMREADEQLNKVLRKDMMLCTAWGILDSVNRTSSSPDSTVRRRIYLPSAFSKKAFNFVAYNPLKFSRLRELRNIDPNEYCESFSIPADGEEKMTEKFTEGRSGSFFYFTHDRRYMVKSINNAELRVLVSLLDPMIQHFEDNPQSLLCRFFGLYSIQMAPEQMYFSFVIMENIFARVDNLDLHEFYDLKGSTVNRRSIKDRDRAIAANFRGTRKDLDLERDIALFNERAVAALHAQLACDTLFLNEHGIMDYSLLVGIHNCYQSKEANCCEERRVIEADLARNRHMLTALICHGMRGRGPIGHEDSESVYFVGIIDMLQLWNWSKRMERFFKINFLRKDPSGISAIEHDAYASRFTERIKNKITFCTKLD